MDKSCPICRKPVVSPDELRSLDVQDMIISNRRIKKMLKTSERRMGFYMRQFLVNKHQFHTNKRRIVEMEEKLKEKEEMIELNKRKMKEMEETIKEMNNQIPIITIYD